MLAAGILFAVLGATDWVDGYIARHFDQGSEIGKILDPVSDRIMLIAGAVGLIISGDVPLWVGVLVLAREAVLSVVTLILAASGRPADRCAMGRKSGHAGTDVRVAAVRAGLGSRFGAVRDIIEVITWLFTIGGLILSYYAACALHPDGAAGVA